MARGRSCFHSHGLSPVLNPWQRCWGCPRWVTSSRCPRRLTQLELKEMLDEAKPGVGDQAMSQESIWAICCWGFASPNTNPGTLLLHLLLPFPPPVGSGARWAHFPSLSLVLPSVSPCCPAPALLGPTFACCWGQAQLSTFCAQGHPSLGAQDRLQLSSSRRRSSSGIRSPCASSPQQSTPGPPARSA